MSQPPSVKVGNVPILFRPLKPPELGINGYDGPEHSVTILPVGHRREPDCKPFNVETTWEKDVEIPMRDGVILRADIFRPVQSEIVPAILPWSPYGKTGRGVCIRPAQSMPADPAPIRSFSERYAGPNGRSSSFDVWL